MGGRATVKPNKSKSWDDSIPQDTYFKELDRIAKNYIVWGGNYFPLKPSQYFAIWDKGETMYGRDFSECEFAWVKSGGTRIFKKNPKQPDRINPTQKPVALYEWLLTNYAKEGDRILDTHLGSGSNAIACNNLGFEMVGIELDEAYYNAACERIINQARQERLFP